MFFLNEPPTLTNRINSISTFSSNSSNNIVRPCDYSPLKKIFQLLIDIVKEKFEFDISISYRRNAITYCTKNFDENNDRFYVC